MKFMKNRRLLLAMSAVLALVIAATATFAWITSKNQLANEFSNEGFANSGLVVIEPPYDFKWPNFGATQPKEVSILNTGSSPMLARVTFEEMIKLLGNNGDITYNAVKATGGAGDPAALVPVPFDMGGLAGWKTLAASGIVPAGGVTIPAGVTVYKLDSDKRMFKAVYTYTAGTETRYQIVKFDGQFDPDMDTLTAAAFEYGWYTAGTARFNSWNGAHNYDDSAGKNLFKPAAWDPGQAKNYPAGTPAVYKPTAAPGAPDRVSYFRSTVDPAEVSFEYNAAQFVTGVTGALASYRDKWFYNEADGYFYYMGVIEGGAATPDMLTGVTLDGSADQALWQKYEYTLVVCVEGLQAHTDALTDTAATGSAAGWQLTNANLIAALTAVIDDYYA